MRIWSDEEKERLKELRKQGYKRKEIAEILTKEFGTNRTVSMVKSQLRRLKHKKGDVRDLEYLSSILPATLDEFDRLRGGKSNDEFLRELLETYKAFQDAKVVPVPITKKSKQTSRQRCHLGIGLLS